MPPDNKDIFQTAAQIQEHKLTADYIFDGYQLYKEAVLTIDDQGQVLSFNRYPGDDEKASATYYTGILSPGFINAHCHLELSHLKGAIPKGTGLPGFAGKVMELRRYDKAAIEAAIIEADAAMWAAGIQAVGDICNTTDSLAQKNRTKIKYRNFIECLGFLPQQAAARFDNAYQVWQAFYQQNTASSLVPHAPYSVSKPLFDKIASALAAINPPENRVISMHNQESGPENEFFQSGTGDFVGFYQKLGADISFFAPSGKSSLQTVLPCFSTPRSSILLVHSTFTNKKDLEAIDRQPSALMQSISFVICPGANLYIEGRLPDIPLLQGSGHGIAIGTDSLASNDGLSIATELQHIRKAYPEISIETLLGWATLNGAEALGFDGDLGSFEIRKRPGVILLDDNLEVIKRVI